MHKFINLFFLLIILLTQINSECQNSDSNLYNKIPDSYTTQQKYEFVLTLYEQERYTKALEIILPLTKQQYSDKLLEFNVNLIAGRILNEYRDNREAISNITLDPLEKEDIRALKYLKRALSIAKNIKKAEGEIKFNNNLNTLLAESYIELSLSYLYSQKKDSSKIFLNKLIEIESFDNRILKLKARGYVNLGRIYVLERDLLKAEELFLKAISINKSLGENLSLAVNYNNLANIYVEQEDYNKAKTNYSKALTYLESGKTLKEVRNKEMIFENIAWALYNLKDYKAYKYVTESYAIRDSLKDRELKKDLKKIEARHNVETVKKAEENKRLKAEKKTWAVGIAGVIVSLLFLYIANLAKLRQRNLSLEYSQNELQQQKKLEQLKSQSQVKIINATIDGKETERKQIAEILHDNVSALLSSANMHLEASCKQFDGSIPLELQKTRQIIAEASEKIRDLSHNLMSSVLLKFGLEYAIKDVAKKFSNSDIKINTAIHNVYRYSQEFEIKTFNIIQELVNNILKHSNAKNAYIMMEEEYNNLAIIVKDDGEGFDNKTEEDKGIGLNQIEARIHMMNGTFLIESAKGEGTKASIRMPVVRRPKMHTA